MGCNLKNVFLNQELTYVDDLVKKKGMPRYTLEEIEGIIHEYRGVK